MPLSNCQKRYVCVVVSLILLLICPHFYVHISYILYDTGGRNEK